MRLQILAISVLPAILFPSLHARTAEEGRDSLFVLEASVTSDTGLQLDAASALRAGRNWNTVISGNVSGNIRTFDRNGDGYSDVPGMLKFSIANGWSYRSDRGTSICFGVGVRQDARHGGQAGYDRNAYMDMMRTGKWDLDLPWGADITERSVGGGLKAVVPVGSGGSQNLVMEADYTYQDLDSWAGGTEFLSDRHSSRIGLLYRNRINESHEFGLGLGGRYDRYGEDFLRYLTMTVQGNGETVVSDLAQAGVSGEYTFRHADRLTVNAVLEGNWYNTVEEGERHFRMSPRLDLKYSPDDRVSVGVYGRRSLEYSGGLADCLQVLATGKTFMGDYLAHTLEDSWTCGGKVTVYLPFGASSDTGFSAGYSRVWHSRQMVVDYEYGNSASDATRIWFYSLDGRRSFSDNFLLEFNVMPVERFAVKASFLYTDARIELRGAEYPVEKPLVERFRGELDLQYATLRDKWIFGFTASVHGPSRIYNFMEDDVDADGNLLYRNGRTPVYPFLSCRVTRKFRLVDVYLGGENLTDFRQKNVVLGSVRDGSGAISGRQPSFDASVIWGPLAGIRIYAGVRFSLDRQER